MSADNDIKSAPPSFFTGEMRERLDRIGVSKFQIEALADVLRSKHPNKTPIPKRELGLRLDKLLAALEEAERNLRRTTAQDDLIGQEIVGRLAVSGEDWDHEPDPALEVDLDLLHRSTARAVARLQSLKKTIDCAPQRRQHADWQSVMQFDYALRRGYRRGVGLEEETDADGNVFWSAAEGAPLPNGYRFYPTHAETSPFFQVCEICFEALQRGIECNPSRAIRSYRRHQKHFLLPAPMPPRPRGGRPYKAKVQG